MEKTTNLKRDPEKSLTQMSGTKEFTEEQKLAASIMASVYYSCLTKLQRPPDAMDEAEHLAEQIIQVVKSRF